MKVVLALATLTFLATTNVEATTLTFGGFNTGESVSQTYGDNVTATTMGLFTYGSAEGFTPNVTTAYGSSSPTVSGGGYGDLLNVLYEANTSSVLNITFSADTGFLARLHSFELGAYAPYFISDPTINSVTVFNSLNTPIFSQSNVQVSKGSSTPIIFAVPLADTSLRIEIDSRNLGSREDGIAVDNIVFSQISVPEPSSTAFIVLGFVGVHLRRLRNRTKKA